MKVFLDDLRAAPNGWAQVHWPDETIALLETGEVEDLSLITNLATTVVAQAMTFFCGAKKPSPCVASNHQG